MSIIDSTFLGRRESQVKSYDKECYGERLSGKFDAITG